jgi:hypothetical protein
MDPDAKFLTTEILTSKLRVIHYGVCSESTRVATVRSRLEDVQEEDLIEVVEHVTSLRHITAVKHNMTVLMGLPRLNATHSGSKVSLEKDGRRWKLVCADCPAWIARFKDVESAEVMLSIAGIHLKSTKHKDMISWRSGAEKEVIRRKCANERY